MTSYNRVYAAIKTGRVPFQNGRHISNSILWLETIQSDVYFVHTFTAHALNHLNTLPTNSYACKEFRKYRKVRKIRTRIDQAALPLRVRTPKPPGPNENKESDVSEYEDPWTDMTDGSGCLADEEELLDTVIPTYLYEPDAESEEESGQRPDVRL